MEPQAYIEEEVLDHYLWHNYHHLTTRFENFALMAFERGLEGKSALQAIDQNDDPSVISAFERRDPNLRALIIQRITRDPANMVIITRCPSCARIVATPRAQQCQWCFHDWHPSA